MAISLPGGTTTPPRQWIVIRYNFDVVGPIETSISSQNVLLLLGRHLEGQSYPNGMATPSVQDDEIIEVRSGYIIIRKWADVDDKRC